MGSEREKTDKTALYLREELNSLRRDMLDIRDAVAVRAERSASHLAVQTTLMVICLVAVLAAALFAFLAATRSKESGDELARSIGRLREQAAKMDEEYAAAVGELERVKAQRDKLAKELTAARRELVETRLELANRRSAGEQTLDEYRKRMEDLSRRCEALEREAARADALAARLEAARREVEALKRQQEEILQEAQKKARFYEKKITELRSMLERAGKAAPEPTRGRPGAVTPKPTPRKSISPKDIKKKKEREFEKL